MIKKFVSKEATWRRPFWNCIRKPGCVCVTSFLRLEIQWRRGQKPATEFASLTRSEIFFLKRLSTSLSSVLSFSELEHVWFKQYGYPKWRQRGQIWASLETNFVTKTCTLETNFGEWLTLVRGFYYCWQRMYVFLDWPSPLKYSGREKSKLFFSYSQNRSKRFYAGRTKKKTGELWLNNNG